MAQVSAVSSVTKVAKVANPNPFSHEKTYMVTKPAPPQAGGGAVVQVVEHGQGGEGRILHPDTMIPVDTMMPVHGDNRKPEQKHPAAQPHNEEFSV